MGDSLKAETRSSITGEPEALFLDEKDRRLVHGKRVILIDDVVSTGSTLERMAKLMDLAGAIVVAEAALLTEGESEKWSRIIALGHLPLFPEGDPKEPY
jgi:adenine phosphoribosyltransferase